MHDGFRVERPFEARDLERLLQWLTAAGLGTSPRLPAPLLLKRLTEDPAIVCRVWSEGGVAVGCYRLDLAPDRTAELTLIVDPARQRRGVGAAMAEAALQECRRRRLRALVAVVRQSNEQAQRFFAAIGFEGSGIPVPGFVHFVRLIHRAEAAAPLEIQP